MKYILPLLLILVGFSSCKKDEEKQAEKDETIITQYISDHGLNATATGSGLYYIIDSQGGGASCNSNSTVVVAYSGYFTNGDVFDESLISGIEFNLQGVISGWTEGIPYFKEGGVGRLLIPSALAYGESGSGSVPGNSVLIFDVTLIDVL